MDSFIGTEHDEAHRPILFYAGAAGLHGLYRIQCMLARRVVSPISTADCHSPPSCQQCPFMPRTPQPADTLRMNHGPGLVVQETDLSHWTLAGGGEIMRSKRVEAVLWLFIVIFSIQHH